VTNLGRAKGQAAGVKNGTLATLERVKPDRFVAHLDDGRRVAFDPAIMPYLTPGGRSRYDAPLWHFFMAPAPSTTSCRRGWH